MVIDFHVHIFPDALAPKARALLLKNVNYVYKPVTDMTVAGLLEKMDSSGVDISVPQPVVTKPSQLVSTNEWVRSIASDRLIPFGGIYPSEDHYKEDIDFVAGLGIKGLKFHAEYQHFILDDIKMLRIYDYAISRGLMILHHGGFDPGSTPPFGSNPKRFLNVAKAMHGGVIIASHLGGHAQWDDVERYIVGTDIYLDTSMGFEYYPREQFLRIVRDHGSDKILFASDSPWSDAAAELQHLRALPITEDEKENILHKNAERLLFGEAPRQK